MFNKTAVFNSAQENWHLLFNLFDNLKDKGYVFYFFNSIPALTCELKERKWPAKKIYLGPQPESFRGLIIFFTLLPLFYLFLFFVLAFYKYNKKIDNIICLGGNEKIIITPLAKIFKLKPIWIEDLKVDYEKLNKFTFCFLKIISRWAKIVTFSAYHKIKLEKSGIAQERLTIVRPGIKLNHYDYQENIFSQMVKESGHSFKRKFFTIGVILDLNKDQKVEALLQAVKKCLAVIPNIQLVIVGDGEERKNLSWFSKKMEIDSLVWFVGKQSHFKKWLDSFDVYIVAKERPHMDDIEVVLKAMAAGLPVLGPNNSILEDIVEENKTGCLLELDNSEMLARQIIKLYKDRRLKLMLGQYAQEAVKEKFFLERMAVEFIEVFN